MIGERAVEIEGKAALGTAIEGSAAEQRHAQRAQQHSGKFRVGVAVIGRCGRHQVRHAALRHGNDDERGMDIWDQLCRRISGGKEHSRTCTEECAAAIGNFGIVHGIAHQLRYAVSFVYRLRLPARRQHDTNSEQCIYEGAMGEFA